MEGIMDPNKANEELESEQSLRPSLLDAFIGQNHMKDVIQVAIDASKKRGETIDHILFYGPPGLGKTTLARIIANEMGSGFKSTSGPVLTKAGDLAAILTSIEPGDVFFIDEIHRLNIAVEEMLYSAIEDYTIDILIGEGPSARSVKLNIPKFTLIGATTRFGLLSTPLRTRFGILSHLEFYSQSDLTMVIKRAAGLVNIQITEDGASEMAKRARGTPRIALRLLRRVRDFADMKNNGVIDKSITDKALLALRIDALGLDETDRRYIRYIAENYNGGPVGIETITAGLTEDRDSIEDTIEPYLLQIGFLQRSARGRILTKKALDHIHIHKIDSLL